MGRVGMAIGLMACLLASCQEPTQVEAPSPMPAEQSGKRVVYPVETYEGYRASGSTMAINQAGLNSVDGLVSVGGDVLAGKYWRLVESYDPYNGGVFYRPDSTDPQHGYYFGTNGSFTEDHYPGGSSQVGTWGLSGGDRTLLLHYTDQSNRDLTYEVRTLTTDTLSIAWQGRHGMVVETYVGMLPIK